MSSRRAYLDHNATAPVLPEVAAAVARALELSGNPSSVHGEGRAARAVVEQARDQVAALVGARQQGVVFTSGGTEGAAMALRPGLMRESGRPAARLLHLATEHACVREGHGFGAAAEAIPVDGEGVIDLRWLARRLAALASEGDGAPLLSVQAANNETGVVQPLAEIGALAKAHCALFHCDAVQAAGRIGPDYRAAGVDVLTMSAHKLGGPKGVGAVVSFGDGLRFGGKLIGGGGQERGLRGGTENVPGIAGFGVAAERAASKLAGEALRLAELRDAFEAGLVSLGAGITIFGSGATRLPNTSCFAIPGVAAEKAVIRFDLGGVALSSGSACSSGKVARSHVLQAMGVEGQLAACGLRASFGWSSSEADVEQALDIARRIVEMRTRDDQAAA